MYASEHNIKTIGLPPIKVSSFLQSIKDWAFIAPPANVQKIGQ
jgi:hypothetical protein